MTVTSAGVLALPDRSEVISGACPAGLLVSAGLFDGVTRYEASILSVDLSG